MAAPKTLTIKDLSSSYNRALKKMHGAIENITKFPPMMRGQQAPIGKYMQPPAAPSVAFNVNLRE
jgi:hypothetical protein